MWSFFVGLALLANDVLSQGFQRFPASPLRPISPISGFHNRPIVAPAPVRSSSQGQFGLPLPAPVSSLDTVASSFGSSSGNPCQPSPCGPNTRCSISRTGVAQCRCLADYVPRGHTIIGCKPQCVSDQECSDDYRCSNQKCVRVCKPGACGLNADCVPRNHQAVCRCPTGYSGNADRACQLNKPIIREPPQPVVIDPCNPSPCGSNADCRAQGETPVCSCPRGYEGNPLSNCVRGECIVHTDCPSNRACQNLKCIDPCVGVCGIEANCVVRNHQPVCSCPRNYIGDPFRSCRRITEFDVCNPSPCGENTNCKGRAEPAGGFRAVCSCIGNYIGSPLTGCRAECISDNDCAFNQHCRDNRCRNPCIDGCGEGAYCDATNHRANCRCPEFFQGSPQTRCFPECTKHEDCSSFQACSKFKCIDPCAGSCGTGADCKVERHNPICSCPRGFTGDPFVSCRRFTLDDLCANNPCGTNADCQPGKDRSGNDRPVCTCPVGFIGNPLISCQRGDCTDPSQCPDHQTCYGYVCQSPCYTQTGSVCGENAECKVKNHIPVCSCPRGYTGNPLEACRISANARIAAGRSHRLQ